MGMKLCGHWALGLLLAKMALTASAEKVYFPRTALELELQANSVVNCRNHLVTIMHAAEIWAMDNADQPPPGLEALAYIPEDPSVFYCPGAFHATVPTNWADVDWNAIDYTWGQNVNWQDPTNVACVCRVHNTFSRVEGSVGGDGYRAGWPLITASPMDVYAAPGEEAKLELKLAPHTAPPASFQWRRSHLEQVTNVVRVEDPDHPPGWRWVTNIVPVFVGTNLPGQTAASLEFSNLQTRDTGFYSVAISNSLGVALSRQALVGVENSYAGLSTNSYWSDAFCGNNLKEIWIFARLWDRSGLGRFPESFADMTNNSGEPMFGWPLTLYCRADTNHIPPLHWSEVDFSNTSYELSSLLWTDYDVFCRCRAHGYYISRDGTLMLKPFFKCIHLMPGGNVEVSFRTFAGKENVLQYSDDPEHWQTAGSYGAQAGEFQYQEPAAREKRFYRLQLK
jgi:hypothetical protein